MFLVFFLFLLVFSKVLSIFVAFDCFFPKVLNVSFLFWLAIGPLLKV